MRQQRGCTTLDPDADHRAVARVREIHELLDAVDVSQPLAAGEYAAAIVEWERAARRIEAVKLRLVAAGGRAGSASLTGSPKGVNRRPRGASCTTGIRGIGEVGAISGWPSRTARPPPPDP
jgi:hypothetical protein